MSASIETRASWMIAVNLLLIGTLVLRRNIWSGSLRTAPA